MNLQQSLSGRLTGFKVLYLWSRYLLTPNEKAFVDLKNKYKGEDLYIAGLGPSLTINDLELLQGNNKISASVNGIFYLFDKTSWRPDIYFVSDVGGIEDDFADNLYQMCEKEDIPIIFYNKIYFKKSGKSLLPNGIGYKANVINNVYDNSKSPFWQKRADRKTFSKNCRHYVIDGATCIISVIQLAYYMGFKRCFLLGCDCTNGVGGQTHAAEIGGMQDPQYAETTYPWFIKDYDLLYHDMLRQKIPMQIFNCTRGGALEVFPRVSLEKSLEM